MESTLERNFWRFWLGGLLILTAMIAMNPWFVTDVSPWGIRDHQSAGTAERAEAIQAAWLAAGVLGRAQIGIYRTTAIGRTVLLNLRYFYFDSCLLLRTTESTFYQRFCSQNMLKCI